MRRYLFLAGIVVTAFTLSINSCEDSSTEPPPPAPPQPLEVDSIFVRNKRQFNVFFNINPDKPTASRVDNYLVVESVNPGPAGMYQAGGQDTLDTSTAALLLLPNERTALITLNEDMSARNYDFTIRNVESNSGEVMVTKTFTQSGSTADDMDRPQIIDTTPITGSGGAGVGQSIIIEFSEPMVRASVFDASSITTPLGLATFTINEAAPNIMILDAVQNLPNASLITVRVHGSATDLTGNNFGGLSWTFSTLSAVDQVPPFFAASSPEDLAQNVSRTSNIRLSFSEAIDPGTLIGDLLDGAEISVNPPIEGVTPRIVDNGLSVLFVPDDSLMANTQYTILIPSGAVRDLAGNLLSGTRTVRFTTGSGFDSGVMSGTITGDSGTPAANPNATQVVATTTNIVESDDDLAANGVGAASGAIPSATFNIDRLPDGTYWPIGVLDSNRDNELNPDTGDAFGAFGADVASGDMDPDSVVIAGGAAVGNVDFPLWDTVSIRGLVTYTGTAHAASLTQRPYYVVAFDSAGFDTTGGLPSIVARTEREMLPYQARYTHGQLATDLDPGTYVLMSYLDLNDDAMYTPGEPFGFFERADTISSVRVTNGIDATDNDIEMQDPGSNAVSAPRLAAEWRLPPRGEENRRLRELAAWVRREMQRAGF